MFINIVFRVIGRLSVGFSEWYAVYVYPLIVGVFGRINGLFPFAVVEIMLYILILSLIAGVVYLVIRLVKGKKQRIKTLLKAAVALCCTASTILLLFLFGCEINYNRRTFSEHSGLKLELYGTEELRLVIDEVIDELIRIAPQISTGEHGQFVMGKGKLNTAVPEAMRRLGEIYPELDVYYPKPKPVLMSRYILSPAMISGVFSPFTIEALYNSHMPDSYKPFVALHELSHLSGFMREDEANFIAFLACRESLDPDLLYSGYTSALGSLLGAYDGDDWHEIFAVIPEQVLIDFEYDSTYWFSFRQKTIAGVSVSAVSSAVNDAYLKAQGQEDGVRSYGRVADLLIADYLARNS